MTGIDDRGEVVGYYGHGLISHGFLRKTNGKLVRIDPPGGVGTSRALAISGTGSIVGQFSDSSGTHGYLRTR